MLKATKAIVEGVDIGEAGSWVTWIIVWGWHRMLVAEGAEIVGYKLEPRLELVICVVPVDKSAISHACLSTSGIIMNGHLLPNSLLLPCQDHKQFNRVGGV